MQETNLQAYLRRIAWDEGQFTNDQLEVMLAASCLRFLEGLADSAFVLGLSEEVRKRQVNGMNISLQSATGILHDLAEKLDNNTILVTDKDAIRNCVDNAQEVITKR